MSKKNIKTNAMRILDTKKVKYNEYTYEVKDGHIDGVSVADYIGKSVDVVFKTLVTKSNDKNYYIFVVPVDKTLDLKKAAKASSSKNVEMINVSDINKITGYIRGGCSPIGMKKLYKTYVDESARGIEYIIVSAGKIGYQVELNPNDLIDVIDGDFADLVFD